MFTTLRSVSRMKRALKKGERPDSSRPSVVVEEENDQDFMKTFMWYGGTVVLCVCFLFRLKIRGVYTETIIFRNCLCVHAYLCCY